MSVWRFSDLFSDDVAAWVSRQQLEERERGVRVPISFFMDQLAARAGITPRELDRYMKGQAMPRAETLVGICAAIGSARSVEFLARECRLAASGPIRSGSSWVRRVHEAAAQAANGLGDLVTRGSEQDQGVAKLLAKALSALVELEVDSHPRWQEDEDSGAEA